MQRLGSMLLIFILLALTGCEKSTKVSSIPQGPSDQYHSVPTPTSMGLNPTPTLTINESNSGLILEQTNSNMVTLWIYAIDVPFADEPDGYFTIGSTEIREFDFSSNNRKHAISFSAEQFEKLADGDSIAFCLPTGEIARDFGKLDKSMPYIQEQIQPRKQWDLALINDLQQSIDDQAIRQSLETASEQLQLSTSDEIWATPFSINPAQSAIYFSADRAAIDALVSIPSSRLMPEQQATLTALIERMTALNGLVVHYLIHQQQDRYEVLEQDWSHWEASGNLLLRGDELVAVNPIKAIDYYEQAWDLAVLTTQERFKNDDVQTDEIIYLSLINRLPIDGEMNGYFRIGSLDMLYYSKDSVYLTPDEFKKINDGDEIVYVDSQGKVLRFYDNFSKKSNVFSENLYRMKYYHGEQLHAMSQAATDDALRSLLERAYEQSKLITSHTMWESTNSLNLSRLHEYFAAERELVTILSSIPQADRHKLSFDVDGLLQNIINIDQVMLYHLLWHRENDLKILDESSASKIGEIPIRSVSTHENMYINHLNNYQKMYELIILYTQSAPMTHPVTEMPSIPKTGPIYGTPLNIPHTEVVTLSIYMPRMLSVPLVINRMDCAYFLIGNTPLGIGPYLDHTYSIQIPKDQLDQLDGRQIIYRYHSCDSDPADLDDTRAHRFGSFDQNTLEASLDIQHQRTIILEDVRSYIETIGDPTALALLQQVEQRLQATVDASFWETFSTVKPEKIQELLDHDRQIMQILSDLSDLQPEGLIHPLDGFQYSLLLNDRYILQWTHDHPPSSVDPVLWSQAGDTLVRGHATAPFAENTWGPITPGVASDYFGALDLYIQAFQLMQQATR